MNKSSTMASTSSADAVFSKSTIKPVRLERFFGRLLAAAFQTVAHFFNAGFVDLNRLILIQFLETDNTPRFNAA
jgi:hypothetical protein